MRWFSINRIPHRWLIACALLGLFAMAEGSYALITSNAGAVCLHQCLGDPDCGRLSLCDTAVPVGACCELEARALLSAAEIKPVPSCHQKDRPSAAGIELQDLSKILAHSYHASVKSDQTYSAGAGTATYLATARLRI